MAEQNRITLTIEGLPEDGGHLRLSVFMSQLQGLSAVLGKLDRLAAGGEAASYFRVVALQHNSPATVVLEPHALPKRPDTTAIVIDRFRNTFEAISRGEVPSDIDPDLLDDFRALARPVGKKVAATSVALGPARYEFTERFAKQVELALAVEETCHGTVDGRLEQINIHGGANTFRIYPLFGPSKIACKFPPSLLDDAVAAVNRRVEVSGLLKYRTNAIYPHEVAIETINPYPPDSELPALDELRGRAPDATGSQSSEAFIRELRDDWH